MRYWWVNHNQTGEAEVANGYLWSPKREVNGARSQFYDNMKEIDVGDVVYSYKSQQVSHVGIVSDHAVTFSRPHLESAPSSAWSAEGWLVPVDWASLPRPIRPKDALEQIAPLLPEKYSPIRADTGDGNQKAYLSEIGEPLGVLLSNLTSAGSASASAGKSNEQFVELAEDAQVAAIQSDLSLSDTEREHLIASRRGQGRFRRDVLRLERICRVSGVSDPAFLVASHIKPWRFCANAHERLDGNNGLLLTPNADRLFDRGLMTFNDDGSVRVSARLAADTRNRLGLGVGVTEMAKPFSSAQRGYLAFHHANIFLGDEEV